MCTVQGIWQCTYIVFTEVILARSQGQLTLQRPSREKDKSKFIIYTRNNRQSLCVFNLSSRIYISWKCINVYKGFISKHIFLKHNLIFMLFRLFVSGQCRTSLPWIARGISTAVLWIFRAFTFPAEEKLRAGGNAVTKNVCLHWIALKWTLQSSQENPSVKVLVLPGRITWYFLVENGFWFH